MKQLESLPSFPLCVDSHGEQTAVHLVLRCIDEVLLTSTEDIYQDQDNSGLYQIQGQVNPGSVDKAMECLLSGKKVHLFLPWKSAIQKFEPNAST